VVHRDVWTLLSQGDLNTCWSPRNEGCKSPLPDSEKTLMDIGWINITLNDVQYRNVAALLPRNGGNHAILRLEKSSHYIQDSGLANSLGLFNVIARKWCVRCHQEMASRRWYQRSNNADKVVMHVARITEGSGTGGHDCGHLFVILARD
jgi:hypothetical protein